MRHHTALALVLAATACSGMVEPSTEDPGPAPAPGAPAPGTPRPAAPGAPTATGGTAGGQPSMPGQTAAPGPARAATSACKAPSPQPALRRLTNEEYERIAKDVFAQRSPATAEFPKDAVIDGFDNNAEALVLSGVHVERYRDAAERLAWDLVARAKTTPAVIGCEVTGANRAACLRTFIGKMGRRLFRRPLADAELADLLKVADAAAADPDPYMGFALVTQALLQSPNFLFRVEVGTPDPARPGVRKLTGFEVATRLAFFLWGSTPDEPTLDAAAAGGLDTADGVAARAMVMLKDARARESMRSGFFQQWMRLDELPGIAVDTKANPTFNETVRTSMGSETRKLFDDTLWAGNTLDLLTAGWTSLDGALAEHYGLTLPAGSMGTVRYDFKPEDRRGGLLTQGSILTLLGKDEGVAPILRGQFVRTALLCQPPPPPPDNVPGLPEAKGTQSVRQRLEAHRTNPSCAGCHGAIDPIGFGLENFDLVGRYRAKDAGGNALTGEGEVQGLDGGRFVGAVELGQRLRAAPQFSSCVATQVFRYAWGRLEGEGDACLLGGVTDAFRKSNHGFQALLVALAGSEAFRTTAQEGTR